MMEPTSEVAAFNTRLEADLVVAKLDEAGIDAFVVADNLGGTFPMMQMITGGYRVHVLTAIADEAREIIVEDLAESPQVERNSHSAIWRFLTRLTPVQALGVVVLLIASVAGVVYAVTQGTL